MPKRTDIQSILIIGLLAAFSVPSAAEVTRNEDGPPGSFSVGPWEGRCIRDGWLGGSRVENCTTTLKSGSISIIMARRSLGMMILVNDEKCPSGNFRATMDQKALGSKDRAALLEKQINGLLKKQAETCSGKSALPVPITPADLADILTETDGLEF
jgi:hypothetical protein